METKYEVTGYNTKKNVDIIHLNFPFFKVFILKSNSSAAIMNLVVCTCVCLCTLNLYTEPIHWNQCYLASLNLQKKGKKDRLLNIDLLFFRVDDSERYMYTTCISIFVGITTLLLFLFLYNVDYSFDYSLYIPNLQLPGIMWW